MKLRERNRLAAMRATQRIALERFESLGFDNVKVEEIALEAGMAASTVFRHFGTKEHLVLWDEHAVELDQSLGQRLKQQSPLAAMRDAFIETLASRYDAEPEFQLRRIKFIYSTTALHAAAVEADYAARNDLSQALGSLLSKRYRRAATLLAGAALLALDVAFERWQASDAARPLAKYIAETFADLERLNEIT